MPHYNHGKEPTYNVGDIRDTGSIPGLGRSPGGGHGNPLQYSCLGNPMDRGAWQSTVHGIAKSQAWLSHKTTTAKSNSVISFSLGYWKDNSVFSLAMLINVYVFKNNNLEMFLLASQLINGNGLLFCLVVCLLFFLNLRFLNLWLCNF